MAQNILTAENLIFYRNPAMVTSYTINSIWTTNDGEPCMNLPPSPYHWTSDGTYYKKILCDYFSDGKRYLFDLWIDSDTAVSGGANRPQGITIYYKDGTSNELTVTGQSSGDGLGYQHKRFVTPEGKNVLGIMFYYYTSTDTFYRWDSSITEYETTKVEKNGILKDGILKEDSNIASISNGGMVNCNEILEI